MNIRAFDQILIAFPIFFILSCSSDYQLKKIAHKWSFEKVEYSESRREFLDGILDSTSYIVFNSDESVVIYNNFTKLEYQIGNWYVKNDSLVLISPEEKATVPISFLDESNFEFSIQLKDESEPIDVKLIRE